MTIYPFDRANMASYRARARRLGEMVADRDITRDDAQLTLGFVIDLAAHANPDLDRSGLQACLHHDMRDHGNATHLARVRQARQDERALADIAEAGLRRGDDIWAIKRALADAAKTMTPPPPIDTLESSIKTAQWRVKWTPHT